MERDAQVLKDGRELLIREADAQDAGALLGYIEDVSGESDFLSFGPGEFELGEAEEAEFLRGFRQSDNQLCLVSLLDGEIVGTLHFSAGRRRRVRHSGEFGMSIRKRHWGLGIGSLMLDTLIRWAGDSGIVRKINLRVRTDNERAIRLYQRKGFVKEGTIRNDICVGGAHFDHHWMGLVL